MPTAETGESRGRAVTVVVPTRNRRELLLRTLRSVLDQQDVDLRVVVVDDGSTDGTADAVRDLGRHEVLVLRHEVNKGVSAARNAGLALAETPWVAFVDDDDLWAPDKLAAQLSALAEMAEARWSCAGTVRVDGALRVISQHPTPGSGDISDRMLGGNAVPGGGSGVLVDTGLAREVGGFDESMSILADWDFYLRLSLRSPIAAVDRPLVAHYVHQDSMYFNPTGIIRERFYLGEKFCELPDGRSFDRDYAGWFVHFALMALRLRDTRAAAGLLVDGFRTSGPVHLTARLLARGWDKLRSRALRRRVTVFAYDEPAEAWLRRYT